MSCDRKTVQRSIDDLVSFLQYGDYDDYVAYWDTLGDLSFCYEKLYEKQKPIKVQVKSPIMDLKNAFATMTMTPEEFEKEILDALADQFTPNLNDKVKALYSRLSKIKPNIQ